VFLNSELKKVTEGACRWKYMNWL